MAPHSRGPVETIETHEDFEPRGASVRDSFSHDDVVVERQRAPRAQWQRGELSLVVGLCGNSIAAESGFLRLGYPVAVDLDPAAPQAVAFAKIVRDAGDLVFVHVAGAPRKDRVAKLRSGLGAIDGIASRDALGMADALRGTGLSFFDERGDADELVFAQARVPLIRRDVTADDRTSSGYILFMLGRAASLSRRVGPVVVFVRPVPSTLHALARFDGSRDVAMVALR